MLELVAAGVDYKKAGLQVRERLVFRPESVPEALEELSQLSGAAELVLLSTCNRTELYAYTDQPEKLEAGVRAVFSRRTGLAACDLDDCLELRTGSSVARHLLEVACGIDSMVTGENEIQGQVREAFCTAQSAGMTGAVLSALFRAAATAGKRVRTETAIGESCRSVATVVVRLAEEKLGCLADKTAVLIGAGKISSTTARALKQAGLRWILLANRTYERAQKLAALLDGQAFHLDLLEENLGRADILICSTGAPHYVIHPEMVERVFAVRAGQPLLMVDLAVPRDIDPKVLRVPGVSLVDIDGLQALVAQYCPVSLAARESAGVIIEGELERFAAWLAARQAAPLIQALRMKADEIAERQIDQTLSRLGDLTPAQRRSVEAMGYAIVSRLLHEPIVQIKQPPEGLEPAEFRLWVESLFALDYAQPDSED